MTLKRTVADLGIAKAPIRAQKRRMPASMSSPLPHLADTTLSSAVNALLKDAALQEKKRSQKAAKTKKIVDDLNGGEIFVWLVVTLKEAPLKGKLRPSAIPLKHSLYREGEEEVCFFVKDPQRLMKDYLAEHGSAGVTRVMGVEKLRKRYSTHEGRRELMTMYDVFLVDNRVAPMMPNLLGNAFLSSTKMPLPVDMRKNVVQAIKRAISSTAFAPKQGTSTSLRIGRSDFSREQLLANIAASVEGVVKRLRDGWGDVQSLSIKTNRSPALPIYLALPTASKPYVKPEKTATVGKDAMIKKRRRKKRKSTKAVLTFQEKTQENNEETASGEDGLPSKKAKLAKKGASCERDDERMTMPDGLVPDAVKADGENLSNADHVDSDLPVLTPEKRSQKKVIEDPGEGTDSNGVESIAVTQVKETTVGGIRKPSRSERRSMVARMIEEAEGSSDEDYNSDQASDDDDEDALDDADARDERGEDDLEEMRDEDISGEEESEAPESVNGGVEEDGSNSRASGKNQKENVPPCSQSRRLTRSLKKRILFTDKESQDEDLADASKGPGNIDAGDEKVMSEDGAADAASQEDKLSPVAKIDESEVLPPASGTRRSTRTPKKRKLFGEEDESEVESYLSGRSVPKRTVRKGKEESKAGASSGKETPSRSLRSRDTSKNIKGKVGPGKPPVAKKINETQAVESDSLGGGVSEVTKSARRSRPASTAGNSSTSGQRGSVRRTRAAGTEVDGGSERLLRRSARKRAGGESESERGSDMEVAPATKVVVGSQARAIRKTRNAK